MELRLANTSAEAMDIAAARVDAKSGIYLDNMRQSIQCEGEIYLGMLPDVYVEEGREVEIMSEDGDDGTEILSEPYTTATGVSSVRNDFQRGQYKVIASVTEATATRRDKTVKSALNMAENRPSMTNPIENMARRLTATPFAEPAFGRQHDGHMTNGS